MTVAQPGVYAFPKAADGPRGSQLQLGTKEDFNSETKMLASC